MIASSNAQTPPQAHRDQGEGNMIPPKEYCEPLVMEPKEMEIKELPNK